MGINIKYLKLALLTLWAGLFLTAAVLLWQSGYAISDVPELLNHWLNDFGLVNASLIYIVLYTIRPLIFFPATLLTISSGLIFGPVLGIVFTVIGENFSASFAFALARWFGRSWVASNENEFLAKWEKKLQQNGLVTVLILRMVMLPFDLVNYGCGLTSLKYRDYALGTAIGIMPALIAYVLLGGSVSATNESKLMTLILSLIFMALGLGLAFYLKHKPGSQSVP